MIPFFLFTSVLLSSLLFLYPLNPWPGSPLITQLSGTLLTFLPGPWTSTAIYVYLMAVNLSLSLSFYSCLALSTTPFQRPSVSAPLYAFRFRFLVLPAWCGFHPARSGTRQSPFCLIPVQPLLLLRPRVRSHSTLRT